MTRQNIAFQKGDALIEVQLIEEIVGHVTPAAALAPPASAPTPPPPPGEVEHPEFAFVKSAPPAEQITQPQEKRPSSHVPLTMIRRGARARGGSSAAQPAALLVTVQPPYPVGARDLGVEAVVRLRVRIGLNGCPRSVEIARSSGRFDFDSNSVSTVRRQWRFTPARDASGAAIESTLLVAVHFTLKS